MLHAAEGASRLVVEAKILEGLTNAEFGKAEKLFTWSGRAQLTLAVLSAVTVFVSDTTVTLLLAILAAVIFAGWAYADWLYRASRAQAERGRRALLVVEGLVGTVSPGEIRDIESGFTVTKEQGERAHNPEFFASTKERGKERLLELIEESAFYSCRLYRLSAASTWRKLVVYGSICFGLFVSTVYFIDAAKIAFTSRLALVVLIFLISQEVLGSARDYARAHLALSSTQARIRAIRAAGYPEGDLLVFMGDYNSAVEGAPMMAPGVYKKNASHLDELWRRHQQATG
jgi:hypothetical protein